jgi:hypothetical protein
VINCTATLSITDSIHVGLTDCAPRIRLEFLCASGEVVVFMNPDQALAVVQKIASKLEVLKIEAAETTSNVGGPR